MFKRKKGFNKKNIFGDGPLAEGPFLG